MSNHKRYVLALDQGTFSSRCILFDETGDLIDSAQQGIDLYRKSPREIEQDATQIIESVQTTLEQVLDQHADKNSLIIAAGLATQRSSIVAWKPSNGAILSPVLSWQDTRAFRELEKYQEQVKLIQEKTGLRLTAHYGVSKMHWLLENNSQVADAAAEQDCVITPLASLILYHITEEKQLLIDGANASRTLLCNLADQDWDRELLDLFKMEPALLPRILPSNHNYGTIKNTGIKISSVNGDQTAALFAEGKTRKNNLYVNLGTGAFVLNPVAEEQLASETFKNSQLLAGIARSSSSLKEFYMEGTVNGASAALDWLIKSGNITDSNKVREHSITSGNHEVIFINSVGGVGSPIWRQDIEPRFINDDRDPNSRVTAVLESIVFLLAINIEALRKIKPGIDKIEISGGLSNNQYICQCLADLVLLTVEKNESSEATARGTAWLALDDHSHWINHPPDQIYQGIENTGLQKRYRIFKDFFLTITPDFSNGLV